MHIGATEQEVQESKKQELTKPDRRKPAKKDEKIRTIYYYYDGGRRPDQRYYPEDLYVPIENYSNNLIRQLDIYLNKINKDPMFDVDTVEVLVTLRSVIFPNNKEYQILRPTQSLAVREVVQRYTKCIMKLVGELAECVLIDACVNNDVINRVCMNIALFKGEILETYDIPYNEYVAYSTSVSCMLYKDSKDGIYKARPNGYYNPHHTSMDIGWCKKDNIWDQLRTEISDLNYVDNAKLQVKATLDCSNLNLEAYLLTPVIVFDYDHGIDKLKERYPHHAIYSANNLFPDLAFQMERYFQIIAAYVSGLSKKLNISEMDLKKDERLKTLFNTSVHEMTSRNRGFDTSGLIQLAEDAGKPIIISI